MLNNIFLKNENIEVYTPCSFETNVKGFWLDNEGKLYIDNILIQKVNELQYQTIKKNLYSEGEKAIFYIQNEKAYIESEKEILITLKNNKDVIFSKYPHELIIKDVCKKFNGCTIYKIEKGFKLDIWY